MKPNSAIVNCSAHGHYRLPNSLLPLLVRARRIVREGPMSHTLSSGHYPFGGLGLSVVRAAIFLLSSTEFDRLRVEQLSAYNSRVWQRIGGEIVFSADGGDLAAGWRLGFGQLVNFGPLDGCWLIEADGAKHSFASAPIGPAGSYRTTDGTFIDYHCSGQAKYPNGTVIEFTVKGADRRTLYPALIMDRNGNFITIAYRNNVGPHIARSQTRLAALSSSITTSTGSRRLLVLG
jgi:hypothetical protein